MIIQYRIFQEENGQYTVREVFYEHDGRIITYGHAPLTVKGASIEDLASEIESLRQALLMPILTLAEIETEMARQPAPPKRTTKKRISHEELVAKFGLTNAPEANQAELVLLPATS